MNKLITFWINHKPFIILFSVLLFLAGVGFLVPNDEITCEVKELPLVEEIVLNQEIADDWVGYTLEELQQPDNYSEAYRFLAIYKGCFLTHEIDKCLRDEPCSEVCQDWLEIAVLTEKLEAGK